MSFYGSILNKASFKTIQAEKVINDTPLYRHLRHTLSSVHASNDDFDISLFCWKFSKCLIHFLLQPTITKHQVSNSAYRQHTCSSFLLISMVILKITIETNGMLYLSQKLGVHFWVICLSTKVSLCFRTNWPDQFWLFPLFLPLWHTMTLCWPKTMAYNKYLTHKV